ncbi:MAG TPA: helix-turn-helix transcriptional regulator [candidate division Zixibacteria bacterium]|nr:helix-turn-helix transcriptional regulator [candidate division Zixibacteria bacterium]
MISIDVKKLRAALGLTQHQLAARIRCHRSSVARWEIGLARPHRFYAERLQELRARHARRRKKN